MSNTSANFVDQPDNSPAAGIRIERHIFYVQADIFTKYLTYASFNRRNSKYIITLGKPNMLLLERFDRAIQSAALSPSAMSAVRSFAAAFWSANHCSAGTLPTTILTFAPHRRVSRYAEYRALNRQA